MNIESFVSRLEGVKRTAAGREARCPGHEDKRASLCIAEGNDGRILLKCQAGCTTAAVVGALGMKMSDLFPENPQADSQRRIVAAYDYRDEAGQILFQVVRFEPKAFRQRRPDGDTPDGWVWKLDGTRRVLYRLPEILAAGQRGETIVLAEGEKDVAALVEHGFAATCNAGGAGKWLDDYTVTLRGADVVIVADNDAAGRNHARLVAGKLHGCAKCVRILELPDFNAHPVKDAFDFFAAGATAADLQLAIAGAQPVAVDTAPDLRGATTPGASKPISLLPEDHGADGAPAPFPTGCLPPAIALMVRAVATTQRVPDSLPGVMCLALVAACIGKGLVLDWRPGKSPTPANIFVLLSALSGSGKSECYNHIARVFLDFERALQERWRKNIMPQLQEELRYAEGQLKKIDGKLRRDSTPREEVERYRGQAKYFLAQIEELKRKLHEPQISLQDATVEKVATVLHQNDETIFSTSSDARKLVDNLLGRYSANKKLADDGIYVAAWSGDEVKVDRQGREGVRLVNPCKTLLWALQPDALEMLLDEDSLQQSGFLARCLVAHTHAEPQYIGSDVRPISEDRRACWENLIRSLLAAYRQPPTLTPSETDTMDEEI